LKIHWTYTADKTFDAQIDYIEQSSPQAARDVGDRVYQQIGQLSQFPDLGRVGRQQGTCELVISRTPFILVYRVRRKPARIEILRVLHGRQQWPQPKR